MNISNMSDEEILEGIQEGFADDGRLNMNYIDIEVLDGSITVGGRVSSEEEMEIIDEVMEDNLRLSDYHNKVWVDESLSQEDSDDETDLKDLSFDDDDEIDDQDYSEEEDDDYYK